jgi:hypothetical protein
MIAILASIVGILLLGLLAGGQLIMIMHVGTLEDRLKDLIDKHNKLIEHVGTKYATNDNVNEVRIAHNNLARLVTGMSPPGAPVSPLPGETN